MKILVIIILVFVVNSAFSQIDTIIWNKKSPLPDSTQRIGCGYFLIDSDFYIAGGQIGSGSNSTNSVWKYHIPTDNWVRLQNLPFGPATCGGSFVINGKGYFLTARDSVSNLNCDTMFWEYNPVGDSWTRRASFPDAPRQNGSYFTRGSIGYVGQTDGCFSTDTHFWQYDSGLDKWTQVATLPAAMSAGSVAIATLPADAYLFGGYDIGGNFLKDVWRFNIVFNQWDSIGQMPGLGRCYSSFWGFDSVIIGGGGENGYTLFNDFYRYDIAHKVWTPVIFKNSFDSTGGGAAFVFNKRGYYFGGYASINPSITFNNDMWSFDASKYIHDTSTGIAEIKSDVEFKVYPNPMDKQNSLNIVCTETGQITFYNLLDQITFKANLQTGINTFSCSQLSCETNVIMYKAKMQSGRTETGKIVTIK